jgi:hypothetical protein
VLQPAGPAILVGIFLSESFREGVRIVELWVLNQVVV